MSSDFYFRKWKKALAQLREIVDLDYHYQETRAHDQKRCDAALRLSAVLGQYTATYNDVWECLQQNLQVQKTLHMNEVLKAVVARILELKHELSKLEASDHRFLSNALAFHKLTTFDAELTQLPAKIKRSKEIQEIIEDTFEKCKEKRRHLEEEELKLQQAKDQKIEVLNWWDADYVEIGDEETFGNPEEKQEELSAEQLEMKSMLELIQAHERSRQIISLFKQQHNKRERWKRELNGTSQPQAPYEIRERSARLIQKVCRAYFELKRQKYVQCKRDEILGLRLCIKPKSETQNRVEQMKANRSNLKRKYDEEWRTECENIKQKYLKRKGDDIREEYRDQIREWFKEWYETIQFFHDIPADRVGGSTLIYREELPSPEEWLEEYKTYLIQKAANKNKTAQQLKFEKMEANRELMMLKKEELMKKKIEEDLRKKMLKNPNLHPGFNYPASKKTGHILEVIKHYNNKWADLDASEIAEVKEKFVKDVNVENAYMEANIEIISTVDDSMRKELKLLKKALKKDYQNNNENLPTPMKKRVKREKKKHKVKITLSDNLTGKLEDLAYRRVLKEYPKTNFEDFIGDPNFAGDDIRCSYKLPSPQSGEIRSMWWERCRELLHGFHKLLLVGPKSNGKTMLVHIMASINDAVLFELDPNNIPSEFVTAVYLDQLARSVAACAKAVQPSVIHLKHVHRLFYNKVPAEEADKCLDLIKRYFIKKLFKSIHKTDNITIVGTCSAPWMTRSKQILKQFPTVVMLPNPSYSTVVQVLKDWVMCNPVIPRDFDISSLAYVLQGYSFGHLKQTLEMFLSPDRRIRIAARGLSPEEVYNHFIKDEDETKADYEKYQKWYSDKTTMGQREKKRLGEQIVFKQAKEDYQRKMEKNKSAPKYDST